MSPIIDALSDRNRSYYDALPSSTHRYRDVVHGIASLASCERVLTWIRAMLPRGRGPLSWLDVGCGLAHTAELAARLDLRYVGLDSSAANVMYARERHPGCQFVHGDITSSRIDGPFHGFHVVSFLSSLHHIPDWKRAVARALSLLADEGLLYIEHEPTRLFSIAYAVFLRIAHPADHASLRQVEIHWLDLPSILPEELPPGWIEYHYDFIPGLRRFACRTSRWLPGSLLFSHWRKVIPKDGRSLRSLI